MQRYAPFFLLALLALLPAGIAHALDKVDPYICPTKTQGSGTECFLEAVPQTYTMCRHIKHIEILEFGIDGAQEGNHGAKTESCIDKHKLLITRPYQAALREAARNQEEVVGLRKLYDTWLESLAKLVPAKGESTDGYLHRVAEAYGLFSEQTKKIEALVPQPPVTAAAKPGTKGTAKPGKSGTAPQ